MSIPSTRFADWLLRTMKDKRASAADVSRGAGIAQSAISAYLNGGARPSYETAMKLAKYWQLDVAVIWAEVETDPSATTTEYDIIPELRFALQRMSLDHQRRLALPAIRVVEELLEEARRL